MKKFKFLALLICAFSMVTFVACSKDDEEADTNSSQENTQPSTEDLLIGSWTCDYEISLTSKSEDKASYTITVDFERGGTGSVSATIASYPIDVDMTWTLDNKDLVASFTILSKSYSIDGTIVFIDTTTMILETETTSGDEPTRRTFTRVNE